MNFEVYGRGKSLKMAFFSKRTLGDTFSIRENIDKISFHNDVEIHLFDADFLDSGSSIRGPYKKYFMHDTDQSMIARYDFILKYIVENNIKIGVFFGSGYPWTIAFLDKFKKHSYAACYFGDDPEGCETTSKYYVKNFHYAFCGGVYFDERTKIGEQYLKWGARKSMFIPLGVCPNKYADPINDFGSRKIDIVYVGSCYFSKVLHIFKLKKYFGERMLFFGRGWNESSSFIKTIVLKAIKFFYNIPMIEELPKDKLVELYQNTKIGFNTHMSYGPSNLRMYELPMNGVMQICDCENGLKELYEIDKEVVAYKNIDEAIKKIEYYLKHDAERMEIAMAGHERVKNNYRTEQSFGIIISEIKKDIRKNFNYS